MNWNGRFVSLVGNREPSNSGAWPRLLLFALMAAVSVAPASAQNAYTQNKNERPRLLRDVGIEQKLNAQVPLDTVLFDSSGKAVRLGDLLHGKPVVLAPVYYECPMLCTQILNGLVKSLRALPFRMGEEFEVVTFSIDPREKPELAEAKKRTYTGIYGRPGAAGWHFLTGEESSIQKLTEAIGFRYTFDPATGQYAHASAILVLTPAGKISRYFYGIDYPVRDLRLGLVEASHNQIGTVTDQVLLFCYHYDPVTGKYGLLIARIIQAAGLFTVAAMGILMWVLFRDERYAKIERATLGRSRVLRFGG